MHETTAPNSPASHYASFIRSVRPLLIDGNWSEGAAPGVAVNDPSTGQALLARL